MIIDKGQHVKCFIRNGMVLEGIVEESSDVQCVLKSLDGKNLMIIHRPTDDILLTKVMLEESVEIPEESKTPKEWLEAKSDLKDKLHEVINPTGDEELDKANLNQLRIMASEQEKQIIAQKKRQHFGTPGAAKRSAPYSNPFGLSAYSPRPKQRSIVEKLSELSRKRH